MNSLGQRRIHRNPHYYMDKLARVKSAANYKKKGRIEVEFLDHGKCLPVWVVGEIDREPVAGDMVVIGWMEGRKDAPYLKGFIKGESYTAKYIELGKDYIRLQLPKNADDKEKKMADDAKKPSRVYIELNGNGIALYSPDGDVTVNVPKGTGKYITKTKSGSLSDLHTRIEALEAQAHTH